MNAKAGEGTSAGAPPRTVAIALGLTLLTQTLAAMALLAPAVLAPAAAKALGVVPEHIDVFGALNYLVAMISGLAGAAAIARFGALRVCQIALVSAALGLAAGGTGWLVAIAAAALTIGVGYGLVNPASAHILARVAPPSMLALVFSIKQTGVPVGGVLAGAIVPSLVVAYGWQCAVQALAGACLLAAIACEPARRSLDAGDRSNDPQRRTIDLASIVAPIKLVWRDALLRDLALASMAYSGTQLILFTYLTAYANLELGMSLVAAGLVYSSAQFAGMFGRVFWGGLSDRLRRPRRLLGGLGVLTFALAVGLAFAGATLSPAGLAIYCAVLGAAAIGWNGIYFAEVARAAPGGNVSVATGGTQFYTFVGALAGPTLAGAIVTLTGRYSLALAAFSVLALAAGVRLIVRP